MKRIGVVLFTTFIACSVLASAQQPGPDGHLPRAGERTADQQNTEKAKPPADKPAPPPAVKAEPPKAAAKPAEAPPAKKAASAAPAKPVKSAAEPKLIDGVPEGAVQIEQYAYSYTDAEGKEWLYRRTPF